MMEKELLRLEKVSWTYPVTSSNRRTLKDAVTGIFSKERKHQAPRPPHIQDISLSFRSGQRVGIVGRNGSGKSTLLRLMAGILQPISGSVEVGGSITPLMDLGSILLPHVSCERNVILSLTAMGLDRRTSHGLVAEIFDWSELSGYENESFFTLSKGMQSRLMFAIATSQTPEIVLIDEILAVGDGRFIQKAKERLDNFISFGSLSIVVSHDLDTLLRMTDEVVWMDEGKILTLGPSAEILKEYRDQIWF